MERIIITGGAGFIGSHIVDELVNKGKEVAVLDNLLTGKKSYLNSRAAFFETDICHREIETIFEKVRPDYVIHHAAQVDVTRSLHLPLLDAQINITGTINLLECCKKYPVKKIIYASSAAVYGHPKYLGIDEKHEINPISFYGLSKYTAEKYIHLYSQHYGMDYAILRYANVYGPRQSHEGEGGVIAKFLHCISQGERPAIYGDGHQTRDFVYVKDIVRANLLALEKGSRATMNIGTGSGTSLNELVNVLKQQTNMEINPFFKAPKAGDIRNSHFNCENAHATLQWKAGYSLDKGLGDTVDYYRIQAYSQSSEKSIKIQKIGIKI